MKTYQTHLKTTSSHGVQPIANRKPVLKSSAIFPSIVRGELDTRVLFMGYWLVKRNIPEVSVLRTLRDDSGNILFRELQVIDTVRAYEVSVSAILEQIGFDGDTFIGSIELEVFSTRDLVFPYPAFVLNYVSPAASTVVHTTGRIYNDLEDLEENDDIQVPEAGFDIIPRPGVDPYFAFVNGTVSSKNACVRIELINAEQQRREKTLELGDLEPYQACFVHFMEDNDREFLDGAKGTVILHHDLKGFFPRFIAGHMVDDADVVSLTHTFYDTTGHRSDDAYWSNADATRFEDSTVGFPVQVHGDRYTELVVYPNHSPAEMRFDLRLCNADGIVVACVADVLHIASGQAQLAHLDIGALFSDYLAENTEPTDYTAQLGVRAGGSVPTRLKFGLNLGRRSGLDIPSNICFNARVPNPAMLTKPMSFKWAPLDPGSESTLVMNNYSFVRDYTDAAQVKLKFWSHSGDEPIEKQVSIPANGSHWFRLSEHPDVASLFDRHPGWVTCEANSPFMVCWYFFDAGNGVVGADHSF